MRPIRLAALISLLLLPSAARPQGNPLGPEFRINTYTTGAQALPSVAIDSVGNFVVAWQSQSGLDFYDVFAQRYSATGAPLGPEFRVNTYTTSDQSFPSVAIDPGGDFVVVWARIDGSSDGVFGQRFASSGAPLGVEFRVNTYSSGSQRFASVAADSSGNFVVVWQSYGQDGWLDGIFGRRFASSGAPLGSEFRVNTYTTKAQTRPRVATSATDNFVVIWDSYSQDGSFSGVFGQRFSSPGVPLGPEFGVNSYTTGTQGAPFVAADSGGNFVVVWNSYQDGSNTGVFGQRYSSAGAALGAEFQINTSTGGSQYPTSVAADPAGNFVVVWHSPGDYSGYAIVGQRYDSLGVPLASEFLVNTYTTGDQRWASVAAAPSGNFVVTWLSNGQDGSSHGVFAQRYSSILPVALTDFGVE